MWRQIIFCYDGGLTKPREGFCRYRETLCHDMVGQGKGESCRDRARHDRCPARATVRTTGPACATVRTTTPLVSSDKPVQQTTMLGVVHYLSYCS